MFRFIPIPTPLAILGFYLALFGSLFLLGSEALEVRQARRSQAWPVTEGTVLRSEVVVERVQADDDFHAEVTYRYRLNGREYQGDRIGFGFELSDRLDSAEAIVARYPAGSSILVYYDPADPSQSVLEPGATAGNKLLVMAGAGAAGFFSLSILNFRYLKRKNRLPDFV